MSDLDTIVIGGGTACRFASTMPNCKRALRTSATRTASSTNPAMSSAERRLLEVTWSYRVRGSG